MTDFSRTQISEVEILGVETKQIPMPRWLRIYEDTPLWLYRMFIKYKGERHRGPQSKPRMLDGHCILTLRTRVKKDDDLVMVQGLIHIDGYTQAKANGINFVPKQKIECPILERLVCDYIGNNGLSDWYFEKRMLYNISSQLFSCNRREIPLVRGYDRNGLLDKVSVDMSLFQPVKV